MSKCSTGEFQGSETILHDTANDRWGPAVMHLVRPVGCTGLAKKFICFLPYDGSSTIQLSLSSFDPILLDYIVTAIISSCTKRKHTSKFVVFCIEILIVKMEENKQHLQHIMLCYFKRSKNALKHKKGLCNVGRRCCDRSNVCRSGL